MRIVTIIVLFGMLAGCAAIRERNARIDDDKCASYGASKGSPEYVACRSRLDAARTQALSGNTACSRSGNTLICY